MYRKMIIAMSLVLVFFASCATGQQQDGQQYTRERDFVVSQNPDGTVSITGYRGRATDVRIPPQIRGRSVTWIDVRAFYMRGLTSVTIPDTVTNIWGGAFSGNQLSNLIIPDSVTNIWEGAFSGNQLSNVIIPDSVTTIGSGAFAGNQLTSVDIPNSVTYISSFAFMHNRLISVTIPDSVVIIGTRAFSSNQLASVTIGNSVTSIGDFAFEHNQLTNVDIPDSVTHIGRSVFQGNPNPVAMTAQQRREREQRQAQQQQAQRAEQERLARLFQQGNFGNLPRSAWVGTFQTDTFRYDFGDGVFVREGPGVFAGMRSTSQGEFRVSGNTLVLRAANGTYSSSTFVGNTFTETVVMFQVVFRRIN
ncbi:MAG: leucine-rich repeat domain-containing protein [Treponema sp.]|nr:leucine-rich repeat domain-containing protein [Treponema sp.]